MLAWSGQEPWPSMPVGRPAPVSTNIGRMDKHHNKHCPGRNPKQQHCCMCSVRRVTWTVIFKCVKCDVVLCVDWSCFEDYHTKKQLIRCLRSSSMQTVGASTTMLSKRTWIFTTFLETYILYYAIRTLEYFKASWAMSDSFPMNCFLFHKFILLSSWSIQVFWKACAKFKYPAE
jgi:hypothetical protein